MLHLVSIQQFANHFGISNAAMGAIQVIPFHRTSKRQLAKGILGDKAKPKSAVEILRQKYCKALQFAQCPKPTAEVSNVG